MMATNAEFAFGFAPKRKVTTYGKAGRRRTNAARPGVLRHTESAPAIPTSFTKSPSRSPEPPGASSQAATLTKSKQQESRKYGSGATKKNSAGEATSQPLPDVYDIYDFDSPDEEVARVKKRRLSRGCSDKGKIAGPYSTPESSPLGGRSPATADEEETTRTNQRASPAASGRTTPAKARDRDAARPSSMPFSAKTTRRLKNLSVGNTRKPEAKKQEIPIRLSAKGLSKPAPAKSLQPPSAAASTQAQVSAARPVGKRRLIDALAAQAEEESSSSDEDSSQKSALAVPQQPPLLARSNSSPSHMSTPSQLKTVARPIATAKKTGPKFTYSQQRTMLADDDDFLLGGGGIGDLNGGAAGGALFNLGRLTKSSTLNTLSYLDEDDETGNAGAVRSLHELRQAGANSRFADEMDDILDRVGSPSAKPSSLRKGALLELAQKMKHRDFRQQFRNHGEAGSLFKSLQDETDVVSGFSILAIITSLLASTTSAHLLQQLCSQGLATLVSRLLRETADIGQLAKDRKQNVSRNGQTSLATIKSSLLELPVWEPCVPMSLSPRTLALKCLDLLMRQPTHASVADEVLSEGVTDQLFSILSHGVSDSACWTLANSPESCDFYLALYILESHSVSAMQSPLSSMWTKQYAPVVASVLETALGRPMEEIGDLESLALRISLNVTNHNSEASQLFVERGLLGRLAESACGAFEMVLKSIGVDSFLSKVLESLIMMLGAMINFCVYYPPASAALEERGDGTGSALNSLMRVFADNHTKTADADSMEETQLNVALGYLSILLGYLCLSDSIRDRFASVHPRKGIQPLVASINEFIAFHEKVAEAQGEGSSRQGSESTALTRLQTLVDQLELLR